MTAELELAEFKLDLIGIENHDPLACPRCGFGPPAEIVSDHAGELLVRCLVCETEYDPLGVRL